MSLVAKRVLLALTLGLIFYALSDIYLWQRIFESHELYSFDPQYQAGHVIILTGMVALGIVFLWETKLWALWYAATFYTLAYSGLEDVLYYWLDGKAIPARCPWLDINALILFHPSGGWNLVASSFIWIGFWAITLVLAFRLSSAQRPV